MRQVFNQPPSKRYSYLNQLFRKVMSQYEEGSYSFDEYPDKRTTRISIDGKEVILTANEKAYKHYCRREDQRFMVVGHMTDSEELLRYRQHAQRRGHHVHLCAVHDNPIAQRSLYQMRLVGFMNDNDEVLPTRSHKEIARLNDDMR